MSRPVSEESSTKVTRSLDSGLQRESIFIALAQFNAQLSRRQTRTQVEQTENE